MKNARRFTTVQRWKSMKSSRLSTTNSITAPPSHSISFTVMAGSESSCAGLQLLDNNDHLDFGACIAGQ